MTIGLGLIRLILAINVIITHTSPVFGFTLGNSIVAVRGFFIISGFYMSLVLNEKYKSKKAFWTNRALKIFPIYWSILILTILSCVGAFYLKNNWGEMSYLVKGMQYMGFFNLFITAISHITIIGREIIMFGGFQGLPGYLFLLIPQAWTLVLELWFYFLAPFILTKKFRLVFVLFCASIFFKYLMPEIGLSSTLWSFRFFPSELLYFLMGWFSYRIYRKVMITGVSKYVGVLSVLIIVIYFALFQYIPLYFETKEWIYYILLFTLVPLSFVSSKNSVVDRQIGELSYPVYISHILINNIANPLILIPLSIDKNLQASIITSLSIFFSILLIKFVQNPIEKIRKNQVKQ